MWVKQKDFDALTKENLKLKESIDELIASFTRSIELRQITDTQNKDNLAAVTELATNSAAAVNNMSQAILMINKSVGSMTTAMQQLAKRVKELEDMQQVTNKWTDLGKLPN